MKRTLPDDKDIARWRRWRKERFGYWVEALKSGMGLAPPIEVCDCEDLLAICRAGGWVQVFDGDMPQPDSLDSYNNLIRHGYALYLLSWEQLDDYLKHRPIRRGAEVQQLAWEKEERSRRQQKEDESRRQWEAEAARRRQIEEQNKQSERISLDEVRRREEEQRQIQSESEWIIEFGWQQAEAVKKAKRGPWR